MKLLIYSTYYVTYRDEVLIEELRKNSGIDSAKEPNISIPIASAITANARIRMSYFKNNPLFKLLYGETDSGHINKDLSKIRPDLVGAGLGQLKLEHIFKKAVYLAPKVYGGITEEGKEVVKVKGYRNIYLLPN